MPCAILLDKSIAHRKVCATIIQQMLLQEVNHTDHNGEQIFMKKTAFAFEFFDLRRNKSSERDSFLGCTSKWDSKLISR